VHVHGNRTLSRHQRLRTGPKDKAQWFSTLASMHTDMKNRIKQKNMRFYQCRRLRKAPRQPE